ncbi:hypothetical protein COT75_05505 [Candidatus Beckwithbacteria bacterium CG10_big_fil_rev_8_21_14_0_10_34_10]|uniref:Uncharacterized protein n=1 Tax=Candidatus Beckwithbacteria bacterium CG10_big_fil_rev_8_21_14_0_10_34_10 TaxID=1974495 RepID=A0A2H0W7N8_9BACT|nr:MAG: hypothetical protein COT75_05505 [Candidatus Beckwithbacteria bacterium CG10_big_fil_rev_8_21_14_0_10_34_10]
MESCSKLGSEACFECLNRPDCLAILSDLEKTRIINLNLADRVLADNQTLITSEGIKFQDMETALAFLEDSTLIPELA